MKKHWWILMGLLTAASLVVELTMHHDPAHSSHWWSHIPGFYIAFGFIGCAAIIIFAKKIVNLLVEKKEDYYDSH